MYSKKADKFYKGHTSDIENRIYRHNKGFEKFTAQGAPWILIWSTTKSTKSEAYQLEIKLKNLSQAKLIRFIEKYKHEVAGSDALLLLKQWSEC